MKIEKLFIYLCLCITIIIADMPQFIEPDSIRLSEDEISMLASVGSLIDTIDFRFEIYFIDSVRVSFTLIKKSDSSETTRLRIFPKNQSNRFLITSLASNDICDSLITINVKNLEDSIDSYGIRIGRSWCDTVNINSTMCNKIHRVIDLSLKLHNKLDIKEFRVFKNVTISTGFKNFEYKPESFDKNYYKYSAKFGDWYISQYSEKYLHHQIKILKKIIKMEKNERQMKELRNRM